MWGGAEGAFYSLVEVVEIVECDEGHVKPGQSKKANAEEQEEPGAVTLRMERRRGSTGAAIPGPPQGHFPPWLQGGQRRGRPRREVSSALQAAHPAFHEDRVG